MLKEVYIIMLGPADGTFMRNDCSPNEPWNVVSSNRGTLTGVQISRPPCLGCKPIATRRSTLLASFQKSNRDFSSTMNPEIIFWYEDCELLGSIFKGSQVAHILGESYASNTLESYCQSTLWLDLGDLSSNLCSAMKLVGRPWASQTPQDFKLSQARANGEGRAMHTAQSSLKER